MISLQDNLDRPHGLLIGFTGHAGVGKDTCANLLAQHGFLHTAFADKIRQEVKEAWGVHPYLFNDRSMKEHETSRLSLSRCQDAEFLQRMLEIGHDDMSAPRSPRWVLQQWGTEYRRAQRPTYWLDALGAQLDEWSGAGRHYHCITDVRFPNEAEMIKRRGGHVVLVERRAADSLRDPNTAAHVSVAVQPAVATVYNNGDFVDLKADLLRVIDQLAPRG